MSRSSTLFLLALAVTFFAITGCGGKGGSQQAAEPERPLRPPPADSPLAKVKPGMGYDEVVATIGAPQAVDVYMTGKQFIPFHFGGDNSRKIARYKGMGTIIFSQDSAFTSSMSVLYVDYDPTEPGYERKLDSTTNPTTAPAAK